MREILIILGCCLTASILAPFVREVSSEFTEQRFLSYLQHRQQTEHREHNAKILAMAQRLSAATAKSHELQNCETSGN
jgi:hypothetical protein